VRHVGAHATQSEPLRRGFCDSRVPDAQIVLPGETVGVIRLSMQLLGTPCLIRSTYLLVVLEQDDTAGKIIEEVL